MSFIQGAKGGCHETQSFFDGTGLYRAQAGIIGDAERGIARNPMKKMPRVIPRV
jgi:hypothetical protein